MDIKNPLTSQAQDQLQQLIEQLVYLDHEDGTDIAGELTDTILEIKTNGLSVDEAKELFADRVKLMKLNSVLTKDEAIRIVEAVIQHALKMLG